MKQRWAKRIAVILAWLAIWQLASMAIGNPMLFCGPVESCAALVSAAQTTLFWVSIAWSAIRIGLGFLCALLLGCVFGAFASKFAIVRDALSPAINVVKSAPVVCIIALLLVLAGSHVTTSIVVAMVVFPPIYAAMIEAAANRDRSLDELASVFDVRPFSRITLIELPQYAPFLRAALKAAVAMSWKAGVAAELIGLPGSSIGEAVYLSKLTLDVAMIISWTAVVIVLGWLCEKAFIALFDRICDIPGYLLSRRVCRAHSEASANADMDSGVADVSFGLNVNRLDKAFGGQVILSSVSVQMDPGMRVCLMAPSGAGKTTLLRAISMLERPDGGQIAGNDLISVVFQDDRLIEGRSALENIALTARDKAEIVRGDELLSELIPDESTWQNKQVRDLSGGMKRRVQIARALAHRSSIVLMDEPFSGLDDAAKRSAACVILNALDGRALLVATHDEDDAALLDASIMTLDSLQLADDL